jgi:hypothetical protein
MDFDNYNEVTDVIEDNEAEQLVPVFTYKKLRDMQQILENVVNELSKLSAVKVNDKKAKTQKKKQLKKEKIYNPSDLFGEFVKSHKIVEPITETQLEGFIQTYFDINTRQLKPMEDARLKNLNIPAVECQVIKEALKTNKVDLLPNMEHDLKYFINTLKTKERSVIYAGNQYKLTDTDKILNAKELCLETSIADKIKPKTLYTLNEQFATALKDLDVLPTTFDASKPHTKESINAMFNRYNNNPFDLYQEIEKDKSNILSVLNVDKSNYVACNDCVYIKPSVLKEHANKCFENNCLKPEYSNQLKEYKLTNMNSLQTLLKTKTK